VIASDGGYRNSPIPFPTEGLLMGVAERYEVVCDFSNFKGRSMYVWNDYDPIMMKAVPYFCNSHLIANLQIGSTTTGNTDAFQPTLVPAVTVNPVDKVMTAADVQTAMTMAFAGQSHRTFKFGRANGHWTINGETWQTAKIAAADVGSNTWEVWRLEAGGGWFHPIHIHLFDMFVIRRVGGDGKGVRQYEQLSPKDVVYLGPGTTIYLVARFGPHKGDYMFHCHNLVHEDDLMMRAFHVIYSGSGSNALSSKPFIINPLLNIIYSNWNYADPMLGETNAKPSSLVPAFNDAHFKNTVDKNLYRIFYPLPSDVKLMNGTSDIWESKWCPMI